MYVEWRWEWSFEILPQMLWATLNTFLAAGVGSTGRGEAWNALHPLQKAISTARAPYAAGTRPRSAGCPPRPE